jgi:hypothetical protein
MKKISLIFLFSLFSVGLYSQQIPNAGFENWTSFGNYSNPDQWDTPNEETSAIPFVGEAVVFKESSAQSGSYACRMEVKDIPLIGVVPGMATLGNLFVNLTTLSGEITGGVPFTGNPYYLRGFYKFEPHGTDSCFVGLIFYKNTNGVSDTIAAGFFSAKTAQTTWAPFEAIITWDTLIAPDTMNILCMSSLSETSTPGTKLWVDNLSFDYAVPVPHFATSKHLNAFLSNHNQITVKYDLELNQSIKLELIDVSGRRVWQYTDYAMGGETRSYVVPNLGKGMYILKVQAGNDSYIRKFLAN